MMAAKDRVVSALNYLTGEGISYYPSGINDGTIMALIEDYFNKNPEMNPAMMQATIMKMKVP